MSTNQKIPDVAVGQPYQDECNHDPMVSGQSKDQPDDARQDGEQNKRRTYRGYLIAKLIIGVDVEARNATEASSKADTWNELVNGWCEVGSHSFVSDGDPRSYDGEMMYWHIADVDDLEPHFKEEDADDEPLSELKP